MGYTRPVPSSDIRTVTRMKEGSSMAKNKERFVSGLGSRDAAILCPITIDLLTRKLTLN